MKLYHFSRLIKKYAVQCQLINTTEGSWKAGEWVEGETTTTDIRGAIVPLSEKRINNSGGAYTQGDCEFITTKPLELNSDTFILYKDKKYKIQENTDYSDYADFYNYIARRVSAFDTDKRNTEENA
uniref:hypothetical protein n=1 Tax=Acetatifactor sp. TaxID=1872090 RepID=UPI0040576408